MAWIIAILAREVTLFKTKHYTRTVAFFCLIISLGSSTGWIIFISNYWVIRDYFGVNLTFAALSSVCAFLCGILAFFVKDEHFPGNPRNYRQNDDEARNTVSFPLTTIG